MNAPDRPFCPTDMLALANAMADAVRPVIRKYFRTRLAVDAKGDASPVTIADREAETLMRDMIAARFPDHGIRGEEFGVFQVDAEWVWILDPIDGTKSFVSGSLAFGTQIALLHRGRSVLGIIDQPITQERWLGEAGKGTMLNGTAIHCSDTRQISDAVVYTSALDHFDAEQRGRFSQIAGKSRYYRTSHDCYAAGLLALGGVDLLLEGNVHDYDILPQMPIVEGAGGIVTDWEGQPLADARQFKTVLMAANPQLHSDALKMLRG